MKEEFTEGPKAEIIRVLKEEGALYAGDILRKIGLSDQNGMKHILELKLQGILKNIENSAKLELEGNSL